MVLLHSVECSLDIEADLCDLTKCIFFIVFISWLFLLIYQAPTFPYNIKQVFVITL